MKLDTPTSGSELTAEAVAVLETGHKAIPPTFLRDLFGRVPPEDLAPYSPQTLADLAAEAFEHLKAPRTPDGADIRLFDLEIEREGRRQDVTVLEVVNDNMPFLLDSTLAEIVDEGYEPLLVAHPILAVERDASGALVRLVGEATAALRLGVKRESFIHIHLPRIDDPETREPPDRSHAPRLRRRGRRRARLAGHARPRRRDRAELPPQPAAPAGGRGRGGDRLPRLDRARQLHLPGLARIPPAFGRHRRRSGRGLGPRASARSGRARAAARARARRDDAGNPRLPGAAAGAHHHQGEREIPRPPPRASRLYRRQAVRRERAAARRVAHRRPVHRERLYQHHRRGALPAPQGGEA